MKKSHLILFIIFALAATVSGAITYQILKPEVSEPVTIVSQPETVVKYDTFVDNTIKIKYVSAFKGAKLVDSDGVSSVYELSDGGILQTWPDSIQVTYWDRDIKYIVK